MGYLAFVKSEVDVAIVEVGMGGHWDATNVIDAEVAVILPIALDHTDYLGPTTVESHGRRQASSNPARSP